VPSTDAYDATEVSGTIGGVIGRLHHIVLDCPDPDVLADFYSPLLGLPVTHRTADFCVVAQDEQTSGVAFQRAAKYVAPTWPASGVPQQAHLDVMVDDLAAAQNAVLVLGARRLTDTVYADPAGHPFCLIPRPSWAPPVNRS
jgi:catechol 2,3-dioxygenase-like lactoylglutathione lyase family enzyme